MVFPLALGAAGASAAGAGISWGTIASGASAASGLMQAGTSVKGGKANRQVAEFNANIQRRNARVHERQAENEILFSKIRAVSQSEAARSFIASQQHQYRARGVASGTGTPYLVALEMANRADEEIQNGLFNSRVQAAVFREQATNARVNAAVLAAGGQIQEAAGRTRAMTSLLDTGFTMASRYI